MSKCVCVFIHACAHSGPAWGSLSCPNHTLAHLLWKWLMSCTLRKMTAFWLATAVGTWGQWSRCCMWWLCRNCSLPRKACSELSSSRMTELLGNSSEEQTQELSC